MYQEPIVVCKSIFRLSRCNKGHMRNIILDKYNKLQNYLLNETILEKIY